MLKLFMNKIKQTNRSRNIFCPLHMCTRRNDLKRTRRIFCRYSNSEKLYFDIYGELITSDLKNTILETANQLIGTQSFLSEKVTSIEEKTISNLISDPKLQDIAILASRHAASADGFFLSEKKFFWLKNWDMS